MIVLIKNIQISSKNVEPRFDLELRKSQSQLLKNNSDYKKTNSSTDFINY